MKKLLILLAVGMMVSYPVFAEDYKPLQQVSMVTVVTGRMDQNVCTPTSKSKYDPNGKYNFNTPCRTVIVRNTGNVTGKITVFLNYLDSKGKVYCRAEVFVNTLEPDEAREITLDNRECNIEALFNSTETGFKEN